MNNFTQKIYWGLLALWLWSGCQSNETQVIIETSYGQITAILNDDTPEHKKNFIKLVKQGYYDGTLFHRVIPTFMIQGGDPDSKTAAPGMMLGAGGPDYTLPSEAGKHHHLRGALAAARQPDGVNPERRSSGSQFYIVDGLDGTQFTDEVFNTIEQQNKMTFSPELRAQYRQNGGYPPLDNLYTVFGMVTAGQDVVKKIANAQRDANDRPVQDIAMKVTLK